MGKSRYTVNGISIRSSRILYQATMFVGESGALIPISFVKDVPRGFEGCENGSKLFVEFRPEAGEKLFGWALG